MASRWSRQASISAGMRTEIDPCLLFGLSIAAALFYVFVLHGGV